MALHAMCETMELKTAGSDSLKLTAQENQIHIDGHAFRASADSLKCNGGATWVLEGHVQFSYKQDGTSAVIRGDHVVLSLNKGQVDFRLGSAPRMPPAVVQPAAYHWAPN